MKEIILQKSNFRCRENIYICRPLRRLRRLAVEYVKNSSKIVVEIFGEVEYKSDKLSKNGIQFLHGVMCKTYKFVVLKE